MANLSLFSRWAAGHHVSFTCATPDAIVRYVVEQLRDHSKSTARNRLLALRSFYRYTIAHGWRQDDPTAGIPAQHPKRLPRQPQTRFELRSLLDACRTCRDRAMLLLFLGSGIRLSELLGIRVRDIDWARGTVLIRGKGCKERWVAPGRVAMAALREHVNNQRGLVWLTREGRPITRGRARKILYTVADRAGVIGVHPHRLRVTFANAFLEAGGDLGALQVLMGHSDIKMTAYYAGFSAATRALDQQRRFNPADRL